MPCFLVERIYETTDHLDRYDAAFGFVVLAENEFQAREFASHEHGDEGLEMWFDDNLSTCKLIDQDSLNYGVILRDFHDG